MNLFARMRSSLLLKRIPSLTRRSCLRHSHGRDLVSGGNVRRRHHWIPQPRPAYRRPCARHWCTASGTSQCLHWLRSTVSTQENVAERLLSNDELQLHVPLTRRRQVPRTRGATLRLDGKRTRPSAGQPFHRALPSPSSSSSGHCTSRSLHTPCAVYWGGAIRPTLQHLNEWACRERKDARSSHAWQVRVCGCPYTPLGKSKYPCMESGGLSGMKSLPRISFLSRQFYQICATS